MRPNSWVLRREPAIALLEELEAATDQLAKLKAGLDRLAEEG